MQWSQSTLCEYHNQPCVLSCYQSGYLHPYPTWENPKPRFWHFEHWFLKVLEIFKNTLLYITVASFDSGRGGGEGFYIRLWCGGRGMWSDRHSYPSDSCKLCGDDLYMKTMVVQPSSQTNTGRPLLHRPFPPPPPKNPRQTDRQMDERNELIYKICTCDSWMLTFEKMLNVFMCVLQYNTKYYYKIGKVR